LENWLDEYARRTPEGRKALEESCPELQWFFKGLNEKTIPQMLIRLGQSDELFEAMITSEKKRKRQKRK